MTVRRNAVANLAGGLVNAILSIAVIPLYLRYLGAEAYGLIGFYATLQAIFGLFDFGLGTTANRGLAKRSVDDESVDERRDFLRTLEIVYCSISIVLGTAVLFAAPAIATRWVHVDRLSTDTVTVAVRLIAVICALQFPFALYQSGLLGLQRQVAVNVVQVAGAVARSVGAVLVLMFVSRSINAFFAWQVLVVVLQAVAMGLLIWREVGAPAAARFRHVLLKAEWRFAAAVSANTIIAAALTQIDKIVLSKEVSLRDLGYYTLANTVASGLWYVVLPINTAVFPRFTQVIAQGDEAGLARLFHRAAQILTLLVLPLAATIIVFPRQLVFTWTHDAVAAVNAGAVVPLLVAGTALYGLSSVPAYLQFAAGFPQLIMWTNIAAAIVLIPGVFVAARIWGNSGVALVWLGLNTLYLLVTTPLMFRRILTTERRRFLVEDVGVPIIIVSVIAFVARSVAPTAMSRPVTIVCLGLTVLACMAALAPAMGETRALMLERLQLFREHRCPKLREREAGS